MVVLLAPVTHGLEGGDGEALRGAGKEMVAMAPTISSRTSTAAWSEVRFSGGLRFAEEAEATAEIHSRGPSQRGRRTRPKRWRGSRALVASHLAGIEENAAAAVATPATKSVGLEALIGAAIEGKRGRDRGDLKAGNGRCFRPRASGGSGRRGQLEKKALPGGTRGQ